MTDGTELRPTFISCCVSFHFFLAPFSVDLILFRSKIKDKTGSGCLLFESCRTEVKLRVGGFGVASVTDHGPRVVGPSNQSWAVGHLSYFPPVTYPFSKRWPPIKILPPILAFDFSLSKLPISIWFYVSYFLFFPPFYLSNVHEP